MDYKVLLIRSLVGFTFLFLFFISIIFNKLILILLFTIIYLMIYVEVIKFFKYYNLIIYIYILLSFLILFNFLYFNYNLIYFIIFIATVVFFDTYSYILGSLFGKKKITPLISPNKTYFGLIGGYILTTLSCYLLIFFIKIPLNLFLLFFYHLIILFSFLGDILESYFKRKSNLKDSSNFIPGHGGFFDRFDSIILSNYLLIIMPLLYEY